MQYFFVAMCLLPWALWATNNPFSNPVPWGLPYNNLLSMPFSPFSAKPPLDKNESTNPWQELYYIYKNSSETTQKLREKLEQKEKELEQKEKDYKTLLEKLEKSEKENVKAQNTTELLKKALEFRSEKIKQLEEENNTLKKSLEIPKNS